MISPTDTGFAPVVSSPPMFGAGMTEIRLILSSASTIVLNSWVWYGDRMRSGSSFDPSSHAGPVKSASPPLP